MMNSSRNISRSINKTLTCGESQFVVGKYPEISVIESTRIINCKVVIIYSKMDRIGSMIHIVGGKDFEKIDKCIKEIKRLKGGALGNDTIFLIATKTYQEDLDDDYIFLNILEKLNIPMNKYYNYIISMDGKKIITLFLIDGKIERY